MLFLVNIQVLSCTFRRQWLIYDTWLYFCMEKTESSNSFSVRLMTQFDQFSLFMLIFERTSHFILFKHIRLFWKWKLCSLLPFCSLWCFIVFSLLIFHPCVSFMKLQLRSEKNQNTSNISQWYAELGPNSIPKGLLDETELVFGVKFVKAAEVSRKLNKWNSVFRFLLRNKTQTWVLNDSNLCRETLVAFGSTSRFRIPFYLFRNILMKTLKKIRKNCVSPKNLQMIEFLPYYGLKCMKT